MLELLLHPPIPRTLLGINPRRIDPAGWGTIRQDALWRYGDKCVICGATERLEVHETYVYDYDGLIATYVTAFPVCVLCHRFIHLDVYASRWIQGEVPTTDLVPVMDHGALLLDAAGMLPTPCQMYHLREILRWYEPIIVDEATWQLSRLAPPGHPWAPDMRQWRLQWRGELYEEVQAQEDIYFDVEALSKTVS